MPGPCLAFPKTKKLPGAYPPQNGSFSAVQGIDGGPGVVNVELLDVADLTQTCDLGIDALKAVGGVNWLSQESSSAPAMSLLAWSPATTISGRRMTLV